MCPADGKNWVFGDEMDDGMKKKLGSSGMGKSARGRIFAGTYSLRLGGFDTSGTRATHTLGSSVEVAEVLLWATKIGSLRASTCHQAPTFLFSRASDFHDGVYQEHLHARFGLPYSGL
jgi:hypothetical protein